ncbi:MAG: VWA domain-containing protein [Polyangiaceae bacterium]
MKALHVGLFSLLGMASLGGAIFAATPRGGFTAKPDSTSIAETSSSAGAASTDTPADAAPTEQTVSEFTSGTTVKVQGHVGHPKMLKNQRGETFLMLEVTGGDVETPPPTVALALVIDKSGSMKDGRLENAQAAAIAAVQGLHDGDQVTVVAFDTTVQMVVPLTPIDTSSRQVLIDGIRSIRLGTDTCISCGVESALKELKRSGGTVARMIVLSDGAANNGVQDEPGFRSLGSRAQSQGVAVSTVGLGLEFNEKLMSAVSLASNGRHYFVENQSGLQQVFREEAAALSQSVANNVVAEIELAPQVELVQVFDRNFNLAGNRISVPLGSLARGELKTVLMKVRTPSTGSSLRGVADVRVAFTDPASKSEESCLGKLGVGLVDDAKDVSPLDPVVSDRVQRTETASALRDANSLFSLGKVDEARRRLSEQRARVEAEGKAAIANAPTNRAGSLDSDFKNQSTELNRAEQGFAAPVAPTPARPNEGRPSPAPMINQKRNNEQAVDMMR